MSFEYTTVSATENHYDNISQSVPPPTELVFLAALTSEDLESSIHNPTRRKPGRPRKDRPPAQQRPVGRPPGTGKNQRAAAEASGSDLLVRRKPGRPPKNTVGEVSVTFAPGKFVSDIVYDYSNFCNAQIVFFSWFPLDQVRLRCDWGNPPHCQTWRRFFRQINHLCLLPLLGVSMLRRPRSNAQSPQSQNGRSSNLALRRIQNGKLMTATCRTGQRATRRRVRGITQWRMKQ